MRDIRLLTPAEASRRLGITPDAVRAMADRGEMPPAIVTESGRRLFDEATVVETARRRREKTPAR